MKWIQIKWKIQRGFHIIRNIWINMRFPFLIPRHLNITYSWYYSIPKGWRDAFGLQLCKEIKSALKRSKSDEFTITDVKEKFGELRIYCYGFPREIDDIIHKYEYISSHTCIDCGRIATKRSQGYILPYCDNCGKSHYEYNRYYEDYDFYGWKN